LNIRAKIVLGLAAIMLWLIGASAAMSPAASGATSSSRFVPSECPETPAPLPALKNARCGFLVVPENRTKDNGRTIRLAVAVVPAVSKKPARDPIVYLAGGPGGPAILGAQADAEAGFNRDRDLILMDQRGTFFSNPLTCREIERATARSVGHPYDAASTGRRAVRATRACYRRLVAKGNDLSAYNTTENAADFADLRRALGIAEWNVYGVSYGTDLALTYMREHPEGIRSVTIDSVVPPHLAGLGAAWISARGGFHNLFRACDAQPACRKRYPHLKRTFARQVRKLESDPLTTRAKPAEDVPPVKVVLDGGALVNWLVGAADEPADVPAAIDELVHGDPRVIAADRAGSADPGNRGVVGYGLTNGVVCSEWVPYQPASDVLRQGRLAFPTYPTSVLSQPPQFPFQTENCRAWNVPKAPASVRAVTRSNIPTLVLSGTFDSKTGESLARFAAGTLPNSTFVSVPGVGHNVARKSPCAQGVLASFLSTPSAPETGCVPKLRPARFKIKRRPRLRVRVLPRRTRAGVGRRFRFKAYVGRDGRRRRVSGVRIRFAKRRARTNRRGKAKIRRRLRRPGVYRVRARKRGFRRGKAKVRVRRPSLNR
jgi:pimeloyl-ACP methyl ester carboxylesterase